MVVSQCYYVWMVNVGGSKSVLLCVDGSESVFFCMDGSKSVFLFVDCN